MPKGFKTGSVTAEIALDTKQFDEAINRLKKEVQSLKTDFGSLEGTNAVLVEVIEELKSEIKSLTNENKRSKKSLSDMVDINDKLQTSLENLKREHRGVTSELSKERKENAKLISQLESVASASNNAANAANKIISNNEKVVASENKVQQSMKQTEAQTKKTASTIQKQFTEMLYERVRSYGSKGSKGVFADAFRNQMRYLYESMDSAEFEKRLNHSLKSMGIKSRGKGSMELWDFGGFFKPDFDKIEELVSETEKVTESSKKASEAIKEETKQISEEGKTSKKVAEETVKANKDKINSTKKTQQSIKEEAKSLKKLETNAKSTSKSVQRTLDSFVGESNTVVKSVDNASKAITKLEEVNAKSAANQVKSNEKVTASLRKEEIQTKKLEKTLQNAMVEEAYNYISGLGKGRRKGGSNYSLLGTDTTVLNTYKELGKTKIFDYDKFISHMRKTFEGLLPPDMFKKYLADLQRMFKLGLTDLDYGGMPTGIGGLPVNAFKELENAAKGCKGSLDKVKSSLTEVTITEDNVANKTVKAEAEIKQLKETLQQLENTPIKKAENSLKEYLSLWSDANITVKRSGGEIEIALRKIADMSGNFAHAWKNTEYSFKRSSEEIKASVNNAFQINTFEKTQSRFNEFLTGFNRLTGEIVKTTDVLNKFNFKLLEGVDKETIFYQRTVQLASAMQRMNTQGTSNWTGRSQFNYSSYISSINQINNALTRQAELEAKIKAQALDKYYAKVNSATQKYWTQIREGTINLQTYKSNLTQITEKLDQQAKRTAKLTQAQNQLWHKYHRIDRGTYISNMNDINAKLKEQTTNTNKTSGALKGYDTNIRNAGRGLTSFNNGVVQTAHSGRILSNTLYQIRGALLSLKMIFTAMGGMMLWGFAMEIGESVKSTISAKNEMEAQLKQRFTNSKTGQTDWASIQYVRKELDKLPKTFQKVNKYAIGETVSSIGLEFDLTAKQMKDALPIVTMVSSEYVRAGRKEEEAALAVKDILQGEFQRLSRETGVGKEELIDFGWSGDKEDLDTLLAAIKKAALSRHWDTFAAKATSLNDVVTITKSRFSELGAEVVDSLTPAIIGGFNMIIDSLTGLQNAFGGMGAFWQNFTLFGGTTALFGGILTALPMVTKQMGLMEIATIGWRKSILTAALNLNKTEVRLYGLRKAIAAVVTGTQASELANVRSSKAILGRLLGVQQSVIAERGLMSALVESKVVLKGHTLQVSSAELAAMNFRQKLTYLAGNISIADAKSAGWGKTIKSLITSTKLWGIALKGLIAINFLVWISSVAMWADIVKKRVENYNDMLATGKDKIKTAEKTVNSYTKNLNTQKSELEGLTKGTDEYNKKLQQVNLTSKNLKTAKHNVADLELANKLAKSIKKTSEKTAESHDLMIKGSLESIYSANGVKNVEKYGQEYQKMKDVAYDIQKSEDERYKFEYASLQHIKEHVTYMDKAGIGEKQRIKYITEYSSKAEEAAEHLKQFNQGDLTAGIYYVMDRLTLSWIDLWNNDKFMKFWDSVKKTWEELKPTIYGIKDALQGLGDIMLEFFSTDVGRWTGALAVAGGIFGVLAWKVGGVIKKLKPLGGTLKGITKLWKKAGDNAKEAGEKIETSSGTVTPEGKVETKYPQSRGEWWQDTKGQIYKDATKYARAAVAIAAGMALISEAILLLTVPMWSLSQTGKYFKSVEPSVKQGIEGLKLIAPVMTVLLPPVIALVVIMGKFDEVIQTSTILKGAGKAAVGIAAGMLLVAETIAMVIPSLWALGAVGDQYKGIQSQVQKGVDAMKVVADSLKYLVPFVPVLGAAIGITIAAFAAPEVGLLIAAGVTLGIPVGMLWIAETIRSLQYPLSQIAQLGDDYKDLSNVKRGAETIKVTSEALMYLEEGLLAMTLIKWSTLAGYIADLVGVKLGVDLTQLTGEGGFFDQLEQFTQDFNKVNITPIDTNKVETLKTSATGIDSVKTALNTVKDALKNLPNFDVDNRSTSQKYQDNVSGNTTTEGISNYFEQLKEPITQLNEFITNFNNMEVVPVEPEKVSIIQNSSNAIGAINTAIETVKTALGNTVDAQWNANVLNSGIIGAGIGLLVGNMGASSGLKGGLDELYNSVKDIMDFNTKISGLTSSGSGDTSSIQNSSNMVSALQTEINNLKTTLDSAVPTVKSAATNMGQSIVTGVKSGISTLSSSVSSILNGVNGTLKTHGETWGTEITNGLASKLKVKEKVEAEVKYTFDYLDGKQQEFYDKGAMLGTALSNGFKDHDGLDQHSPGRMARAVDDELGFIGQSLSTGAGSNLPQLAATLANSLSSNFNLDFGLGSFKFPDMSTWTSQLSTVIPTVNNIKTQVSTNFNNMKTNVANSFNNIVNKTRLSMSSMKTATIGHIGNIKSSWRGMQDALIASADHIRSQTSSKINQLKTNLGEFWNKVKHPDQLIGSAGGHAGTIRRRRPAPQIRTGFAGSGGSLFKTIRSNSAPDFNINEYIKCLIEKGSPCYAGGWNFNWTRPISNKFKGWNTHFGKYGLDNFLNVGKFENSNFPVKGHAEVAKQYIFDVISSTRYGKYFDSNYGDDPVSALRAGVFNCWDGTNIVLALARAFGFEGSRGHGTWNGVGHVWANIRGLGIIDPTAIQQRGSFTSSAVKGYHAGSMPRRYASSGNLPNNSTTNHNEVHIHINGDVYGVDDLNSKIEEGANRVARRLFRDSYSGV